MVVTFFITLRMYVYMKKSDLLKSKNEEKRRGKDIMAQIESKEKQLEKAKMMSMLSGSGIGQQQIDALNYEIDELRSRL
ncbi:MAG: hypothetical protein AUK63_1753 [bacterium P3]|nr:MAG: hypothetical protein AUK63_1753 [bacterium P3]KWW38686.1 MAG: hypothetical protein F083_2197 [bacterium F083]